MVLLNIPTINEVLNVINQALLTPMENGNVNITEPLTMEQVELNFSDLPIDSISFIHMIVLLESEFDLEIPDNYLSISELNCVKKVYEVIKELVQCKECV